jgi:hypothetical protein
MIDGNKTLQRFSKWLKKRSLLVTIISNENASVSKTTTVFDV